MKCTTCDKQMVFEKKLPFNQFKIDGWKCACGEIYFDPMQAQRILLVNKLKKQETRVKVGQIRSNPIIRIPINYAEALNIHGGSEVTLKIKNNTLEVVPT